MFAVVIKILCNIFTLCSFDNYLLSLNSRYFIFDIYMVLWMCLICSQTQKLGLRVKSKCKGTADERTAIKIRLNKCHVYKEVENLEFCYFALSHCISFCPYSSLGMRKDKARVKSSLSHVYVRKEKLAEDTETENEDKSLLTECKLYLTNIFVLSHTGVKNRKIS